MGIADRYLNNERVVDRLIKEYIKYGRLIVGVDFDGTIFDYHKVGDIYPKLIEIVCKAHSLGCKIIIYTCRNKERQKEVKEYLEVNNIPYDSINEPIVKLDETDGFGSKIFYSILLDDRAGLESAYYALDSALDVINTIKERERVEKYIEEELGE